MIAGIRGLHCPTCGSTDPSAWRQAIGSPEVWCACDEDDDGAGGSDIVDGCCEGCVHG